jgi:phage internal scaffolding protein
MNVEVVDVDPASGVSMDPRPVFVRGFGNYNVDYVSNQYGVECLDESLAVQSAAIDADINTIVRRFGITGELPQDVRVPLLDDFDQVFDFQSAQNALVAARESFMQMPADVRDRFQNDPHRFVEFCSNPANLPEMRKLGLAVEAVKVEEPKVMKVEVVNPSVNEPKAS